MKRLTNDSGITVDLIPRGASIMSVSLPVRDQLMPVVLGYDEETDYEQDPFFMGATIGRVAGRIKWGRFSLNGKPVQVEVDEAQFGNCLHGGPDGLHAQDWALTELSNRSATFCFHSPHLHGGFPGAVDLTVRYSLGVGMNLFIEFEAKSDADTVLNLTNHAYFNLSGESTIDRHSIQIESNQVATLDEQLIPTGRLAQTVGTAYDFSRPTVLDRALQTTSGVDLYYVLNRKRATLTCPKGEPLHLAAAVHSELSQVLLRVHTTQPGLQFYTGHYLSTPFGLRRGFCLEAQGFPDAPNHPSFPSIQLAAGQRYRQVVAYEFSVEAQPAMAVSSP